MAFDHPRGNDAKVERSRAAGSSSDQAACAPTASSACAGNSELPDAGATSCSALSSSGSRQDVPPT
eukprot:7905248-Karenia_brevis.AAC.1